MRMRAQKIAASLDIAPGASGTAVRLEIPLQLCPDSFSSPKLAE
jgi:hypothetical protein